MDRKLEAVGVCQGSGPFWFLRMAIPGIDKNRVLPLIASALKEDIGPRDLTTSAVIPKAQQAKGDLVVREEGVLAGLQAAEWTFGQVDPKIRFKPNVPDGQRVHSGQAVAFIEGPARGILTAERVALNFLGHLSGIATLTRAFVDRVKRTPAQILDTRKTIPGLRLLEKYAVSVGGGVPHRMGLYDQVLIKDNHIQLVAARQGLSPTWPPLRCGPKGTVPLSKEINRLSAIEQAVREAREKSAVIEVEVTTLQEFRQALAAKADIILLDNMIVSEIQEAVRLRNAVARSKKAKKILLEVSGGVTLETVEKIAATGVDRISVGALTHSAPSLDFALELVG